MMTSFASKLVIHLFTASHFGHVYIGMVLDSICIAQVSWKICSVYCECSLCECGNIAFKFKLRYNIDLRFIRNTD